MIEGNVDGDWREAPQFAGPKNLTQEELGERTDLSKGYISQLERDLSSPSMETFYDFRSPWSDPGRIFPSRKCRPSSGLSRRRQYELL